MRIQLAVVDTDTTYLTRLQERVADAYAGRVELLAFTSLDKALASLAETRTHVLVVHESIEVDTTALPTKVELAHLVDAPDVESVRGIRAVPKFAPVDAFYRAVVELYDAASSTIQMRSGRPGTTSPLVVLTSPAGGVGTTSAAIALARSLAMQPTPQRTLYLSLDPCEDVSARFGLVEATHGTFSDVVYAVKRRRGNLGLQLEQHAYQDAFGTHFFASSPVATDVLELADDDISLLTEHLASGAFDAVVLDVPFGLDLRTLRLLDAASRVVLVSDGRQSSNDKIVRALAALEVAAQQHELSLLAHTGLLYNRFSTTGSARIEGLPITELGGINRFESAADEQIVNAIYASGHLERLVKAAAA